MPLYEYVCQSCETRFEKLVKRFAEEVACPACASGAVDKQLSVFAVGSSPSATSFADGGSACTANGLGGPCGEGGCASGPCGGGGCSLPS
jgi:putative FmdB family regulatory protein